MPSIDGEFTPFSPYPGYSSMAPCMRSCENSQSYNGCDLARCWCNKNNLDLRLASVTRCATTKCTFANMNTQTDVDILSTIQIIYCADKGFSPEGMTVPSTAQARPTPTGSAATTRGAGITNSPSRSALTSGPSATNNPNTSTSNNVGSPLMSSTARIGIGVGASLCILAVIGGIILLFRRRRRHQTYYPPPPPPPPNYFPPQPPPMAPTPYSNHGPFSPPPFPPPPAPLQQPTPIHIPAQPQPYPSYTKGDVSPIEEKAVPAVIVSRKEVGTGPSQSDISSPTPPPPSAAVPTIAQPRYNGVPTEVHGDIPPPRHEIPNDTEITNPARELDSTQQAIIPPHQRGAELDTTQPQPQPVTNQYPRASELDASSYQQSGQGTWGYGYPDAQELSAGYHAEQQQQRQELSGGQNQWRHELPSSSGQNPQARHELPSAGQNEQWRQELPGVGQNEQWRQELPAGQNQWGQRYELGGGGSGPGPGPRSGPAHEMGSHR